MGDLHIVMDENIRCGRVAFSGFGEVRSIPGRKIRSSDLSDVDVLLTRSVTAIDEELLAGTPIQFVGSATTGTDHVDEAYLRREGIAFAHAPGANADSVVEYVIAGLLTLAVRQKITLRGQTIGIVGCGEIGGRLVRRLPALGLEVLANDPPRARAGETAGRSYDFVGFDKIFRQADIVTLHTPLTTEEPDPTHHLIDEDELRRLRNSAWLINTCRGLVVNNQVLLAALDDGEIGAAVLDVWEGEPVPDPELVDRSAIATPHIAGYSYDGKIRGTIMLYEALEEFLGVDGKWVYEEELKLSGDRSARLKLPDATDEMVWLHRLVRQMYDITDDDRRLRKITKLPEDRRGDYFVELRRTYPRRRSFSNFSLPEADVPRSLRPAVSEAFDIQLH